MPFFPSLFIQELAQYQVGITLFLGLLLRDNALSGSAWNTFLDVLLTFTNLSPSFATLMFMSQKKEQWEKKTFPSLFMNRLCALCYWRKRERDQRLERRDESVQADIHVDVTLAAVDAPILPSPSGISPRPHQQSSSAKVHIKPSSEKSPMEENVEIDNFDTSPRAVLPRTMEAIDPGSRTGTPTRRRSSIKEQLVALRVSGKDFVDRLRTSGRSRDPGHAWTPLMQEQEGMNNESRHSLLAM